MVAGNAGKAGKLAAGTFWLPLLFAVAIHTAKKGREIEDIKLHNALSKILT